MITDKHIRDAADTVARAIVSAGCLVFLGLAMLSVAVWLK